MRTLSSALILLATTGAVSASAGICLGWTDGNGKAVSTYTGSTGSKVSWFTELTLGVVDNAAQNPPTALTTETAVTAAINAAYGTNRILVSAVGSRNDQLTNSAVFATNLPQACRTCILNYALDVNAMIINGTLPSTCRTYNLITGSNTGNQNDKDRCLYGLSQAVFNFDACTQTRTTDLALGTSVAFSNTGARCTAAQIADLEGRYGIYRNIMNAGLFGSYVDSGFQAAYKALPCVGVFDAAINAFSTATGVTALKVAGKCGTLANTVQIFDAVNCVGGDFDQGVTVAVMFSNWAKSLGGGVPIATSNTRCTTDELSVLRNLSVFDAMIQCSSANSPTGAGNGPWEDCLGTRWTALKSAIDSASPNKLSCSACFRNLGTSINTNKATWINTCYPTPATSFSPLCPLQVAANGILRDIYTCSGASMPITTTVGSASAIASNPSQINSVAPFIRLARNVMVDTSLTSRNARLASVLTKLSTVPMFANMTSNAAFAPCYGALAMELVTGFDGSADALNSCSDEFSSACLTNTNIVNALSKFETCAGITMLTSTPYTCTDAQFKFMTTNNLPKYIFTQAISTPGATIASVMTTIMKNVADIQTANNVTLPCANCLEDVVSGLFNLGSTLKATCSAGNPSDCLKLPAVIGIVAKFASCSGQSFDVSSVVPVNPSNNGTTTNTTSNDAPVTSVFVSAVTIALGAMLL